MNAKKKGVVTFKGYRIRYAGLFIYIYIGYAFVQIFQLPFSYTHP